MTVKYAVRELSFLVTVGVMNLEKKKKKQVKWRYFTNRNEMLAGLLKCGGSFRVSNYVILIRVSCVCAVTSVLSNPL